MNRTELEKYKRVLEAKAGELSAGLRKRDDIAIEKSPDALDEVQLAGERELAIRGRAAHPNPSSLREEPAPFHTKSENIKPA